MAGLRLTEPAERDIAGLLDWSAVTFGPAARRRYEALVAAALSDPAHDWQRVGSVKRDDIGPAGKSTTCGTADSELEQRPGSFGHQGTSWSTPDDVVTVLRILHDSMDVTRHLDALPQ